MLGIIPLNAAIYVIIIILVPFLFDVATHQIRIQNIEMITI